MDLAPHQVHLWLCRPQTLTDAALLADYRALLTDEDQDRLARLALPSARHTFLVTRALIRATLSRYADVAPAGWVFRTNRYGRPEIAGPARAGALCFNLSHARGLSVLAVARDCELGVDIERVSHRATTAIAEDFFAPAEVRGLRALPAAERKSRFFELWTLKESYIKARGMGLAIELHRFAFHFDGAAGLRFSVHEALDDSAETWQFVRLRPSPAHHLAVAVRRGHGPPYRVTQRYTTPLGNEVGTSRHRPAAG